LRWFQGHLDTASQHLNSRFQRFFAAMRHKPKFAFRKIVGELGRPAPRKRATDLADARIGTFETKKGGAGAPPFFVLPVEFSGP
jgi:hypothetical protein